MSTLNPLEFYLISHKPVTVFTGIVSGDTTPPYMEIEWDTGLTGTTSVYGTSGAPMPGNTVCFGTSAGGSEIGEVRLRSWTPDAPGDPSTGLLSIAENSDVGPNIKIGHYITIKLEFRLWPIYPRPVQVGENVTYYEDYDLAWGDQGQPTVQWRPHAVAGPPEVTFLDGVATGSFIGDRSFALAPGATITNYLWTAYNSNEGTSTSQGTVANPVRFTWNQEGQYLVSLKVTDSNSKTHTQYTWVFVVNPNSSIIAYTDADNVSDSLDFDQGGGDFNFTVYGNADVANFPKGVMIVYAAKGTIENSVLSSWPYRDNVLYVGYVADNSIVQSPDTNTFSIRATSINNIALRTSIYNTNITDTSSPVDWVDGVDLTIDRMCSYISQWRSTLSMIAPIIPLGYSAEIYSQDVGTSSVWGELTSILADGWAKPVVNHQGVIYWNRDYQLMTTGSERNATSFGRNLTNTDWIGDITIDEKSPYSTNVSRMDMSGVYYAGSLVGVEPYFSRAPGELFKPFGSGISKDNLILTSQADLNIRCGLALAKENMEYPVVRANFLSDGSFTNAPQVRFTATIDSNDNNRGLEWNPTLIPRRINRTYNHKGGYFTVDVEFEPDASGPPGITRLMPTKPPVPTGGDTPSMPTGTTISLLSAGSINLLFNTGWIQQVTGTSYWAEGDPWLNNASLFKTDRGAVFHSVDYGVTWTDTSPGSNPPSGSASVSDIKFMDIQSDLTTQNKFIIGGTYLNASGSYESYIGYTTGNGSSWGWW